MKAEDKDLNDHFPPVSSSSTVQRSGVGSTGDHLLVANENWNSINNSLLHTPFDYHSQPESECESLDQVRVFQSHPPFENEGLALRHGYSSLGHSSLFHPPSIHAVSNVFPYGTYSTHPAGQDVHFQSESGLPMSPLTSSRGSSSTSPSSAASSFAFIPQTHYLTDGIHPNRSYSSTSSSLYSPTLAQSSGFPHGLSDTRSRITSISSAPASGMPPPFRSSGNPSPVSPKTGTTARDHYATTLPQLPRSNQSQYGKAYQQAHAPYSTIPRSLDSHFSPMSSSPNSYSLASSSMQVDTGAQYPFGPQSAPQSAPPFIESKQIHSVVDGSRMGVIPTIHAKADKGFFKADSDWTCYRRNYFSVACSYSFNREVDLMSEVLYLQRQGSPAEQIQSFALCITARIEGEETKTIDLVQHTPKRDKGPMGVPEKVELLPHPSGNLGIFSSSGPAISPNSQAPSEFDPSYSAATQQGTNVANFDRIQFKKATANNGKRRAAQQYFHIVVELFAKIARGQEPEHVLVAWRCSAPMVVRGRSPGHYQDDRRNSSNSRGPRDGSSGDSGGGGPRDITTAGAPGDSHSGMTGISFTGSGRMPAGNYQTHNASLTRSSSENQSLASSTSSSLGSGRGVFNGERQQDTIPTIEEANQIDQYPGYQYYPSTLLETPMHADSSRPSLPLVRSTTYKPISQPAHDNTYSLVPSNLSGHDMHNQDAGSIKGEHNTRVGRDFQALQSPSFGHHWHTGSSNNGITSSRDYPRFRGVDSSHGYYPPTPAL